MNINVIHPDFGARVNGIDLSLPLNTDRVNQIHNLIDKYSFLCFPNQGLSDEKQFELTQKLGDPEPNHVKLYY